MFVELMPLLQERTLQWSICARRTFESKEPTTQTTLRTVSELFPEVIEAELDEDGLPSYSAVEALQRQERFVNPTLANHALARSPVPAQSLRRKTGRVSRGRVPGLPEVKAGFQGTCRRKREYRWE